DINQWAEAVAGIYAAARQRQIDPQAATEKLEEMEKWADKKIALVLLKAASQPLEAEIDYSKALCKHEQAERLEAAPRRPGSPPSPEEINAVRDAWSGVASWWSSFEIANEASPAVVQARSLHARACEALDDKSTAAALLENQSGSMSEAERVA